MSVMRCFSAAARDNGRGIAQKNGIYFFEDFTDSSQVDEGSDSLGKWTITPTNSTEPTTGTDAAGGHLVLTNATADADMLQFQRNVESVKLGLGVNVDFGIRFKGNVASASAWAVGLAVKDTTMIAGVSDGVFLRKDDADTNVDFSYGKNISGAARANETTAVINASGFAASTWYLYEMSIAMDAATAGAGRVRIVLSDPWTPLAPAVLYDSYVSDLPDDEELTFSFGMLNGTGGDTVMTVDYVYLGADVIRVIA